MPTRRVVTSAAGVRGDAAGPPRRVWDATALLAADEPADRRQEDRPVAELAARLSVLLRSGS